MGSEKHLRIAVITENPMSRAHGTGVQLLRLLENQGISYTNFYFGDLYGGKSECEDFVSLYGQEYRWWYPAQSLQGKARAAALRTWYSLKVHPPRFNAALKERPAFNVAYVIVGHEVAAAWYLPFLKALGCPYVVHIMDIYHESGLDPESMPNFSTLFAGASSILALTETIRDEIAKFNVKKLEIVRIGQEVMSGTASPAKMQEPVRLIMIGGLYAGGTALLADAWPKLAVAVPELELWYAGNHFNSLPDILREKGKDFGQIQGADKLHQILTQAHIAYLNGPSELDCYGKYSYPSRTSDYFMAGLPVVANVVAGSATESILKPLHATAARIVNTPEELIRAVKTFSTDSTIWREASQDARQFAEQNFNIAVIRKHITSLLTESAKTATLNPK
jgi:glycosyltransferase involved in cell wall biosynthesis